MVVRMFFILLMIAPIAAIAQSVEVKKESSRIEGENTSGYQVMLSASEDEVRSSLSRYLKALGKTKLSGDYITMADPVIAGKKYAGILYATTRVNGTNAAAWIGVPSGSGEESSLDRDIEKLVHEFGVTFQREKIQAQIDESLRALQVVERQQVRLANQNKDLSNKIESNKREKIHLEKSLVANKIELDELTKRIEANAEAQDSVAIATEQIKKVVQMHKEKQRRVN